MTSFHLFAGSDPIFQPMLKTKTCHRGVWKNNDRYLTAELYRKVRSRLIEINETGRCSVFFHADFHSD